MVVDDDEMVAKTVARIVGRRLLGAEVRMVHSVREAIGEIERGFDPKLIFCDMMMPELTGMDFLDYIQKNRSEMESRIRFMSGGATTPKTQEFLESLGSKLIRKPFGNGDIQKPLDEVFGK